jgi:hypothetical protein
VRPFDERRRPPPPRKFSEVDNTDPAFDFERVPATRGGGKKGRRPVVGSDYEDFSNGDVSAPLMEAPPSGDLNADEFGDIDVEEETVTTTIPPLEQAQFNVVREQFEVARKEITTEFSNFNSRLPVAGGSYASMTIGVPGSVPVAAPDPNMSLTGFAAGNLQPALHGKVTSSDGHGGRHERPSSAGGSTSPKTASHKDVFIFSLPEEPAFPGSLAAVIHHNPFRQNFEELNASRTADVGSSSGRVATKFFEN